MSERAPYSRVYWTVRNDLRLTGIYADDHHWATWNRLLLAADMAWPAPADLPANARRASLRALEAAGVIELLPGGLFCFHGLDTERGRRSSAATASAKARWTQSERAPDALRTHPKRIPNGLLDETRRDETRRDEPSAREGLPNLTPDAIAALELRTGRAVQVAGEKQLTEYDRLIEDHGLGEVCIAMDRLREGKAMTARQLVWGAMKLLEPMLDTRAAAKAEDAEQAERDSWKGIDATQAYLRELRGTA